MDNLAATMATDTMATDTMATCIAKSTSMLLAM